MMMVIIIIMMIIIIIVMMNLNGWSRAQCKFLQRSSQACEAAVYRVDSTLSFEYSQVDLIPLLIILTVMWGEKISKMNMIYL